MICARARVRLTFFHLLRREAAEALTAHGVLPNEIFHFVSETGMLKYFELRGGGMGAAQALAATRQMPDPTPAQPSPAALEAANLELELELVMMRARQAPFASPFGQSPLP